MLSFADAFPALTALLQILVIDVSLAGDNALAVGLAASGLPASRRHHAVIAGIAAATLLRIAFALFAVQLLHLTGILAAGGLLLVWVAWKMFRDIRHAEKQKMASASLSPEASANLPVKKLSTAIWQITLADMSMSLDNVLAVAGVAREHMGILVAGLAISVLLMGIAASLIAKLTARHPWIAYAGIVIVVFTALRMVWDGAQQLLG